MVGGEQVLCVSCGLCLLISFSHPPWEAGTVSPLYNWENRPRGTHKICPSFHNKICLTEAHSHFMTPTCFEMSINNTIYIYHRCFLSWIFLSPTCGIPFHPFLNLLGDAWSLQSTWGSCTRITPTTWGGLSRVIYVKRFFKCTKKRVMFVPHYTGL